MSMQCFFVIMVNLKDQLVDKKRVVVTAALPYANGDIHIGNLLEHIQADIFVRFLKLVGKDALLICASDMHGTPIQINAKKAGIDPVKFVEKYHVDFQEDFARYLINYDNFYKTHSNENKELAEYFFFELKKKGYIYLKEIEQYYDEVEEQFLPDRFIKGTCPKCNADDQYGDNCESCGTTYNSTDLLNPKSVLSGEKPILRKTTHYFFKLGDFSLELEAWINDPKSTIQPEIKNWLNNWLEQGLKDWCISRDEPYFGFEVPGSVDETGEKKYFYVWYDAPIGYLSSTKNYCFNKEGVTWEDYWNNPDSVSVNLLGKDIAYFHYLFWPAMLKGMGINIPLLSTHGFITVNGKKMSKSRGTFFTAKDFYSFYGGEKLRFYYASNLNRRVLDINLNLDDFKAVSNNVLMGNLGNFCFRTLSFASKNYASGFDDVCNGDEEKKFIADFFKKVDSSNGVRDCFYNLEFKRAVKLILEISDYGNKYFQKLEPWKKRESVEETNLVKSKICFMVNLVRNLSILIKPVMPDFSAKIEKSFGVEAVIGTGLGYSDLGFDWCSSVVECEKLVDKVQLVEKKVVDTVKEDVIVEEGVPSGSFGIDLRVGEIKSVSDHPNADKLYVFKVDFGLEVGERQIIAGLKKYFSVSDLIGKRSLFCINLKPAKLRGELSCGMSLVAESGDDLKLLFVDNDVKLGTIGKFSGFDHFSGEIDFKMFDKFPMVIKGGKVLFDDKVLKVGDLEVEVDIADGSKVC